VPTRNVPVADAGPLVADVMLHAPRTVSPATTVAEAREAFENSHERMLLVTDQGRFVGAVERDHITDDLDGATTLEALADADAPRVSPHDASSRALELIEAEDTERLPVVEPDGTLVGLVCFSRRKGLYCVDR
jgi:glycine betaine/proline transport system ATP-binding protein